MYKLELKSGKTSVISCNGRGLLTRIAICISDCKNCNWHIELHNGNYKLVVAARISKPILQDIINTQCNPDAIELIVL